MKKSEAIELVQQTFTGDYNPQYFERFISNLFNGDYTHVDKRRDGQYVREAFRAFVLGYRILGSYEDAAGSSLDVLEVVLQREGSLDKARTAQRNFVADYLKKSGRDAALIAFIAPDQKDWRFSLVKLEYSLEARDGKIRTEEELTPAKRWSFLIGRHEGSHTVQSRFVSLLENSENPILKELEEAFNIESVTGEFFKKYCELFFRMKESLDLLLETDPLIKLDFEARELTTVDFAKKTLGQMAFLYFLQKKGWFGVAAGKPWGTGPKDFLRQLFNRKEKYGSNFFDDVLEPLFYEALAQDRGQEAIYPRLNNCRMPFLNGGLFEPMNGYSWETTNIRIPDELFSNFNRNSEGDVGDGILDIFDRYNFTVNESEPLEKEVAVDPEMLGKVFENLLEVKDRKSKGTYYTPREIVHYMCQESLINYIFSETHKLIPRGDIEILIKMGSHIIQNDAVVLEKGREGTYKFMLPETIRSSAMKIDAALASIKVCDPAVGSGAFPLGMLNEIVQARQALAVHLRSTVSIYDLKLHSISHSIYGVDIDPGAVEIAKLRLWLALVVEETEPHPLPNLEHKIMQGNSLISEYEGVKLFDDSFLENANVAETERVNIEQKLSRLQREYFQLHNQGLLTAIKKEELERDIMATNKRKKFLSMPNEIRAEELRIFDAPGEFNKEQIKAEQLQEKIDLYISESQRSKKQKLKNEIEQLKWELIEASLSKLGKIDSLKNIRVLREKNIKPFFIWKLEFSEVFTGRGGFDVIIANPPYVGEKGNKEIFRSIANGNLGKHYQGKMDLFYFFFHLALDIGRINSQNAFITTNYYVTALGARKLRAELKEKASIRNLINFNELRILESALGQHNLITIFSRGASEGVLAKNCVTKRIGNATQSILTSIVSGADGETEYFNVSQDSVYDGQENYIRVGGMGDTSNPTDMLLEKIKNNSQLIINFFDINNGVHSQADYLTEKKFPDRNDRSSIVGDGIYVLDDSNSRDSGVLNSIKSDPLEANYLKPFFKNSDIGKYFSQSETSKRLIYINKRLHNIDLLRNIDSHLSRFEDIIAKSSDNAPYLHRPKFITWDSPKIVCPQRSKSNTFGYNEQAWYASADVYFITAKSDSPLDLKYLLALLNSKLYFVWLYYRGKRKGETLELYKEPLSEIPVRMASDQTQKGIVDLVDQVLLITSAVDYDLKKHNIRQKILEEKLDEMIFDLFDLSDTERLLIKELVP
jgi:adenine-specific DNA-methyltransferase